ncbi:hypothetical protein KNV08_gp105 [Vibrio phage Quinn]|uniref:Uncharacterized protein n=1 Tax=Vibrio phage Quinn TaxID=2736265 RepID=A0A6M9Z5Q8_9CAUD|nr:hypothetical protein KNV08_gp007 [Vibrio phage Quinn]YP_010108615.1 hypothetical protein KNV08_gp105 [Vibrio phage Quinn]QKN85249.1 hypothetical protein QUINN_7 [Vibrio phage Quinn]QKN85429.1 hypothetical protein QUINN_209 [Vibrio phage Quinn]
MEFDNYATALLWAARNGKPFYTVRMDYNKILVILT